MEKSILTHIFTSNEFRDAIFVCLSPRFWSQGIYLLCYKKFKYNKIIRFAG